MSRGVTQNILIFTKTIYERVSLAACKNTLTGHQDTEEKSASLVEQEVDSQGQEGSSQGE